MNSSAIDYYNKRFDNNTSAAFIHLVREIGEIALSIEKNNQSDKYDNDDNGKVKENNKDIYLVSRITKESRIYLGIEEGDYIFAMFKATSPQVIREIK